MVFNTLSPNFYVFGLVLTINIILWIHFTNMFNYYVSFHTHHHHGQVHQLSAVPGNWRPHITSDELREQLVA